ncbi:MAG: Hsp70 family protein, partial [Vicinamibacterales bacterium]
MTSASSNPWVGVDFGTTNSAVALVDSAGPPRLAQFPTSHGPRLTFPSVLYFEPKKASVAGAEAIEHYLASETKGRFIQSLKAYLADRTFEGTGIGAQHYTVEKLIALIARHMGEQVGFGSWPAPRRIVLGRPVHFSNPPDAALDAFASERLLTAIRLAGFEEVMFEYEPVAAAYAYEARLGRDERILIGDFGGGTSDFTIIAVGPGVRRRGRRSSDILATDGVPVAGDAFDRRIIRNLVAPRLGLGGEYLSPPNKFLPVPSWPYQRLERWHYLSFLKSPSTLEMLERVRRTASTPERLEALLLLIRNELGYQLHEAVQRTKFELSAAATAEFAFESGPVAIRKRVTRTDFEAWIAEDMASLAACIDRLIQQSGLAC